MFALVTARNAWTPLGALHPAGVSGRVGTSGLLSRGSPPRVGRIPWEVPNREPIVTQSRMTKCSGGPVRSRCLTQALGEVSDLTPSRLPVLPLAALIAALGMVGCGDTPTAPSSVAEVPTSVDSLRQFSGTVELATPTVMDLSLRIQSRSASTTPVFPTFFATLFAQETSTVTGTYTIETTPPRMGDVSGTLTGASFLTAGHFDGVFTEDTGGCVASRQYSGPVTAAGVRWTAGNTLQGCPSAPFATLGTVELTASGATAGGTPPPDPEPDPDPDPGQVFALTVTLGGTGSGTVTSNPSGIDCGTDCEEGYPEGTVVTLTPTPLAGSTFAGWTGDGDCSDSQLSMEAARSCTATSTSAPRGGEHSPSRRLVAEPATSRRSQRESIVVAYAARRLPKAPRSPSTRFLQPARRSRDGVVTQTAVTAR